jgi:hypothetical protein
VLVIHDKGLLERDNLILEKLDKVSHLTPIFMALGKFTQRFLMDDISKIWLK